MDKMKALKFLRIQPNHYIKTIFIFQPEFSLTENYKRFWKSFHENNQEICGFHMKVELVKIKKFFLVIISWFFAQKWQITLKNKIFEISRNSA